MKLRCEILSVTTTGESLSVVLQGHSGVDPDWYGMQQQEIRIRNTDRTRKAFYVGRIVEIEITPKREPTP